MNKKRLILSRHLVTMTIILVISFIVFTGNVNAEISGSTGNTNVDSGGYTGGPIQRMI